MNMETTMSRLHRHNLYSLLGIFTVITAVSGCSHLPWSEQVKDVRGKYGLLQCDRADFCANARIVQAASNLNQVVLEVRVSSERHSYEIQRVSFDNQKELLNYMPTRPTSQTVNQGLYHSFVRITVPADLMQKLQAERIAMDIHTDRGTIRRYLYDQGQASVLYLELERQRQVR